MISSENIVYIFQNSSQWNFFIFNTIPSIIIRENMTWAQWRQNKENITKWWTLIRINIWKRNISEMFLSYILRTSKRCLKRGKVPCHHLFTGVALSYQSGAPFFHLINFHQHTMSGFKTERKYASNDRGNFSCHLNLHCLRTKPSWLLLLTHFCEYSRFD